MAEFTLPLNSIVKTGKHFKCESADKKILESLKFIVMILMTKKIQGLIHMKLTLQTAAQWFLTHF